MAKGDAILDELREFLGFLASLWGLLASISLFFPLSNLLTEVVPIDSHEKPFVHLSPGLVVVVSTLTCIFLTFATFGRRAEFADSQRRTRYARSARLSFVAALVLLAFYVLLPDSLHEELVAGTNSPTGGIAVSDAICGALYVASFALITRAFLLLAMLEYYPKKPQPADR
jgi:hypothetical protein